jgi:hypothetical protein
MASNVDTLTSWFQSLPRPAQAEVLEFLYGKNLITEGMFMGPAPEVMPLQKGLFMGPAPATLQSKTCHACGRPL